MISACELSPSFTLPVPRLQHPGLVEKKIFPAVTASPGHADTTTSHAGPLQRGRHFTFNYRTVNYIKLDIDFISNFINFSLHRYEQSCSQDPDTKSCAAPLPQCRDAMVEILGTDLRTNCACAGTAGDFRELFECIEYQRLFWSNPCVGKINCTSLGLEKFYNNWRNIL